MNQINPELFRDFRKLSNGSETTLYLSNVDKKKYLFNLCQKIGDYQDRDVHVITLVENQSYRVYTTSKYCFNSYAELNDEGEWEFFFYTDWGGFKQPTIDQALEIISKIKKDGTDQELPTAE